MCALGQAQMYVDKGVQQLEKAKVSQKSARKVSSPRPHCKNPHKRQFPPPRFPVFRLPRFSPLTAVPCARAANVLPHLLLRRHPRHRCHRRLRRQARPDLTHDTKHGRPTYSRPYAWPHPGPPHQAMAHPRSMRRVCGRGSRPPASACRRGLLQWPASALHGRCLADGRSRAGEAGGRGRGRRAGPSPFPSPSPFPFRAIPAHVPPPFSLPQDAWRQGPG